MYFGVVGPKFIYSTCRPMRGNAGTFAIGLRVQKRWKTNTVDLSASPVQMLKDRNGKIHTKTNDHKGSN